MASQSQEHYPFGIPVSEFDMSVGVMEAKNIDGVRDELKDLLRKQTDALRAQTFGGLSRDEWDEFDQRRERIHDLTVLLLVLTAPNKAA